MQDINNLNLDPIDEKENSVDDQLNKEMEITPDKLDTKNINNKLNNDKNVILEHKKCVPLQIYQKVYLDKQKLISEINNLNSEIDNLNKNNDKLPSLEKEIKDLQRNIKNYQNALIKQEKYVNILKSRISKLEKQILKKDEEIMNKDNTIYELNDQVNELTHKIQNIKEMHKLDSQQEIMNKMDEINMLKNKIELNEKKMEFRERKYQNLQNKYLKLLKNHKDEKNGFIFSSFDNMNKSKNISRNNYLNTNIFFSSGKINEDRIDNNNRMHTIFETNDDSIDINIKHNINNLKKEKINNLLDINLIQENNQRYLSPASSFINKNENKNVMKLLPVLKKENISKNKGMTTNKKLIDNKGKK